MSQARLNSVSSRKNKLVTIVGPTASGKTQVALDLAKIIPAEIICADSRTVYKELDIGTAKPTAEDRSLIPHYGLDLVLPGEKYSVANFAGYAEGVMHDIWARNKTAILVGGSGLYLDAVLFGYEFRNQTRDIKDLEEYSNDELIQLSKRLYPGAINTIDVKNTRRLQQLILRGPANTSDRESLKYEVKIIGIDPGLENLQIRIEKRTDNMLSQGFIQECDNLIKKYNKDCPTLQTTGYSAVVKYLTGKQDLDMMREQIIVDTKRLAKKQRTWFRRNPFITWMQDENTAIDTAVSYLSK
jgi:tRNA dimethylallyltransferase